jgi:hypothetical protein
MLACENTRDVRSKIIDNSIERFMFELRSQPNLRAVGVDAKSGSPHRTLTPRSPCAPQPAPAASSNPAPAAENPPA